MRTYCRFIILRKRHFINYRLLPNNFFRLSTNADHRKALFNDRRNRF